MPGCVRAPRLAPEQADPLERVLGEPHARRRGRPGRAAAAHGAPPRGRRPRRRAPSGRTVVRRGSIARLLIRMSWLATATNELMLPSRSASSAAERLEVGVGERAERHRQDVELARLDERQQERRAGPRTRRSGPGSALRPAALAEGHGRPAGTAAAAAIAGIPGHPASSVGLVGEPQQLAGLRVASGRPGSGSARRSGASSRPPRPARPMSRRGPEPREGGAPAGQDAATSPDPRPYALAERVRDPRARPRCRPCRRRGAGREQHLGIGRAVGAQRRDDVEPVAPVGDVHRVEQCELAGAQSRPPAPRAPRAPRGPASAPGTGGPDAHQEAEERIQDRRG